MTADYAKKVWNTYGKIIETQIKKTTADDILFFEQKFNEIVIKRKQELGLE